MYFGHKHVKTRPNCSHKLATFFKYHMPLSEIKMLSQQIMFFQLVKKLS